VSGAVVHVLIDLIRRRAGEIGVAQALALADDRRPFSDLDDFEVWSTYVEGVRLFNAAAMVTGDDAVGLHVGERLLSTADGSDFVDRLRAAGSPEQVIAEFDQVLAHFETTSEAVALEVAGDHALVKVTPHSSQPRHAHLCEMTKGILTSVPTLFGMPPALVSEHECSARGGRACLYALSWDDGSNGQTNVVTALMEARRDHVTAVVAPAMEGAPPAEPERRENGTSWRRPRTETDEADDAEEADAAEESARAAEDVAGAPEPEAMGAEAESVVAAEPEPKHSIAAEREPEVVEPESVVAAEPEPEHSIAAEREPEVAAAEAEDTEPEVAAAEAEDTEPEVVAAEAEPESVVASEPEAPLLAESETVEPEIAAAEDEHTEPEVVAAEAEPGSVVASEAEPESVVASEPEAPLLAEAETVEPEVAAAEAEHTEPEVVAAEAEPESVDELAVAAELLQAAEAVGAAADEVAHVRETVVQQLHVHQASIEQSLGQHSQAQRTIAELEAEVRQLRILLDGALTTTPELLEDGVEYLLSQIAGRADAVITSPSYLLMVRIGPGAPIQLHHRGLESDRAQVLAAELWREHPDDAGGTRMVVDIASHRRRYGRVAVFRQPGGEIPDTEERVLGLFADYAATALDVFGVVTGAKRSDATARALLEFADALSHVTTLAESVQLLAETVPGVTGCDRAIVYLWDGEAKQLAPRAITGGTTVAAARIHPIVPLARPEQHRDRHPVTPGHKDATAGHGGNGRGPVVPHRGSRSPSNGADRIRSQIEVVAIRTDTEEFERVVGRREVVVLDHTAEDPGVKRLMEEGGVVASVVAPFYAAGEFLGTVAANFGPGTPTTSVHDSDLHELLAGLADQAATAIWNLDLLEEVSHMAWHDSLTGLPNRRLFEDRVEQELVRSRRVGEPVCMFFVDIDHFKTVNDTLGHAGGDDMIQQVADRLTATVRSQDTVARVGGDEFAILLPGLADQLAIEQLAQRTLEALNESFILFGEEVESSASIGIAIAPEHGDTYDDLLNRADEAMYAAKDRGRNAYCMYAPPADGSVRERPTLDDRTMYADLIHALDNGEFFLLYQPYIDLKTAEVVGVEALVRWNHPNLGVLEPLSFITLAEKSDVIVTLDNWVLAEACRQMRDWIDRGLETLRLSVNLASRDLSSPDLFESIRRTLQVTGIDPTSLDLEITERVVLDSSGPARDNIERLRRLGVRFTVDDFGLGNSSLSRIGSFPVSTLKIDRSFVQVLGPDGENNALVSAIISMADRLGLDCMAEGVETTLQSRILYQRGCTTAQGYFFSPPLPPSEIERLLAEGPADEESLFGGVETAEVAPTLDSLEGIDQPRTPPEVLPSWPPEPPSGSGGASSS
jgi:diguanylate cyclase (GGDEF)-like protein